MRRERKVKSNWCLFIKDSDGKYKQLLGEKVELKPFDLTIKIDYNKALIKELLK